MTAGLVQFWRLSEGGDNNLGLCCTEDGLVLGRTPLVERRDGRFVARECGELERLFRRGYRAEFLADQLMPGLATVASALNANDLCLACIAAVHLRLPDLPDHTARDSMEAEDSLIKSADWNPALHPRAGIPPNPGWFAPTDGSGDESSPIHLAANDNPKQRLDASSSAADGWIRLRPGPQRIDELADFAEWIANAKPEDEEVIRAEIKRYFYDVGWQFGGDELSRALTDVLKPDVTTERRQQILNHIDLFTRVDPAEYIRNSAIGVAVTTAVTGLPRITAEARTAETAASEASGVEARTTETQTAESVAAGAAADARSEVWKYGWAKRGREIHDLFSDESLHPNFPTIDMFSPRGVATSIKSIDLSAAVYQNEQSLTYRLNNYFDKVSEFNGAEFANNAVRSDEITERVLHLIVPKGSMTDAQGIIIDAARVRASELHPSVDLIITPF